MPVERFQAPGKGQAFRTAPLAITKDQAYAVENLLTHQPGMLSLRGSYRAAKEVFATEDTIPMCMRFGDQVLFALDNALEARRIDFSILGGSVSLAIVITAAQRPWTRSARVGDFAYARGFYNQASPSVGPGAILRWDGTTAAPTAYTNCPHEANDVCAHLERLFVGGGRAPAAGGAATPYDRNKLHWSDLGGPTTDTLAVWQDDVSGLTNEIVVGSPGDAILGLASLGRQLVIFKENSIYAAIGDSPSTFTVRRIANTMGCGNANSILVFDDQCVFLSSDGYLTLYDGAQFTRLGGPEFVVEPHVTTALPVSTTRLVNDYVLVVGRTADGADDSWLLHLPSQAWSRVTTPANVLDGQRRITSATENGLPFIFDGRYIRRVDDLTRPDTATGREPITTSSSTHEIIAGKLTTRLAPLAEPTNKAVVRRVYVDHRTQSAGVGGALPHWDVSVKDASGAVKGTLTIDAAAPDAAVLRASAEQEMHVESNEAMVTLEFKASSAPAESEAAEIHDVWLEYEPAQRF